MEGQVITVGVDGSKSSMTAVQFALEEAKVRGATVRAVTAWEVDTAYAARGFPLLDEERAAQVKSATAVQDRAIERALQAVEDPPSIERRIVRGRPGHALVELSADAGLLVVGTEHKGALKRVVVGSTSNHCTKYSRIPVVVVPFVDSDLYRDEA
ncbi:MAG: universal stress protein [Humibacillus sp.]|nr:universal stress protein [Humibacillus sp.]MDN5775456.1 universal stress protein [Humibacillus sp.]